MSEEGVNFHKQMAMTGKYPEAGEHIDTSKTGTGGEKLKEAPQPRDKKGG